LIAIARHLFASSTLMAEAGWGVGRYAVKPRTINIPTRFANFAMATTFSVALRACPSC
jgi:hypothetical protein